MRLRTFVARRATYLRSCSGFARGLAFMLVAATAAPLAMATSPPPPSLETIVRTSRCLVFIGVVHRVAYVGVSSRAPSELGIEFADDNAMFTRRLDAIVKIQQVLQDDFGEQQEVVRVPLGHLDAATVGVKRIFILSNRHAAEGEVFYRLVNEPLDEVELERSLAFLKPEPSGPTLKAKD